MLSRPLLALLLVLNAVVLMGQIWPEGAPPFARTANIVFVLANLAAFGYLLRHTRPAAR
jgi:hypothetical protein